MNGRGRILTESTVVTLVVIVPPHQFCVTTASHISRECRGKRKNQGRRGNGGFGGRQMADMAKYLAAVQEVLKKLVPVAVFPREL